MLESSEGYMLFALYGVFIFLLVYFSKKKKESSEDFLVMDRKLGVGRGSMSIAVSWIWAPAVFIVSQKAFEQGLPGVLWFTLPNVLCFFVFIPIALKIRETLPSGYTVSQVFRDKFKETKAPHYASLVVVIGYQLGAIIINSVAGATLINLLTGIPYVTGVILMVSISISYSLISGLRASVLSDVAQMVMILGIAFLLVPLIVFKPQGQQFLSDGMAGVSGNFGDLFDLNVAYAFGIASTIGLISGPVADQMFSQRAMAARKDSIKKIFFFGGLIFGVVPILLSILGFVGAGAVSSGELVVSESQMVGAEVVSFMLPTWALMVFAVMAFASLTSTLDSAFCAVSSIIATDFDGKNKYSGVHKIRSARKWMMIFGVVGGSIALMRPQLIWVFLIYGALAASIFFPLILALFWKKVSSKGVYMGIFAGVLFGTPLSIYANINNIVDFVVISSLLGLLVPGVITIIVSYLEAVKEKKGRF